jgi:putative sigma-54 modulation protein
LTHHQAARHAGDRNVAQITVWGKGVTLRTEERADEALAAFDAALDNLQRKVEKYKGKHYHGRGDGRTAAEVVAQGASEPTPDELAPRIARRKKFGVLPMDEAEAVDQMRLLGHDDFFIFYNVRSSQFH